MHAGQWKTTGSSIGTVGGVPRGTSRRRTRADHDVLTFRPPSGAGTAPRPPNSSCDIGDLPGGAPVRTILLATAAAVVLTPLAAATAAPAPDRTLTFEYSGATGVDDARVSASLGCAPPVIVLNRRVASCARFDTLKGERTLVLTAADGTGAPGGFSVQVGDAPARVHCGQATVTLPRTVTTVSLEPYAVRQPGCTGVVTRGTITATLSRR